MLGWLFARKLSPQEVDAAIGAGVPLFRIRQPRRCFEEVHELADGYIRDEFVARRRVWRLKGSQSHYAVIRLFEAKGEIDKLVKAPDGEWRAWDWVPLIKAAEAAVWYGPTVEKKHLF